MTAQTLADRSKVSVENVTYYTPRGILRRIRHRKNNYRLNRESDIGPLRFIRQGKNLGHKLKEIATIFEQSRRGDSSCPLVREIIERRIADHRKSWTRCWNFKSEWKRHLRARRSCRTKRRTDTRFVI